MKTKHLFYGYRETYTPQALTLDDEFRKVIDPIIKKYDDMGFSIRDIEYVAHAEINMACLDILLDRKEPNAPKQVEVKK